jgi:hypothetical protein
MDADCKRGNKISVKSLNFQVVNGRYLTMYFNCVDNYGIPIKTNQFTSLPQILGSPPPNRFHPKGMCCTKKNGNEHVFAVDNRLNG